MIVYGRLITKPSNKSRVGNSMSGELDRLQGVRERRKDAGKENLNTELTSEVREVLKQVYRGKGDLKRWES